MVPSYVCLILRCRHNRNINREHNTSVFTRLCVTVLGLVATRNNYSTFFVVCAYCKHNECNEVNVCMYVYNTTGASKRIST